jgi:hypothetical protein
MAIGGPQILKNQPHSPTLLSKWTPQHIHLTSDLDPSPPRTPAQTTATTSTRNAASIMAIGGLNNDPTEEKL